MTLFSVFLRIKLISKVGFYFKSLLLGVNSVSVVIFSVVVFDRMFFSVLLLNLSF